MIITDVRKRRGRLYQLYLDGEPAVTVDAAAFDESPYRMGGRIDDDQLRELLEAGSRRRAREKALYLLSMRDHSRGELEQKLRQTAGAQAAEEPLGVPAGDVGTAGDGENHGEAPRKKRADSTAVRPLCHAAAPVCGSGEAEGSAGTAELPLVWLVMV